MTCGNCRTIVLAGAALSVAACGGGGGSGVYSTPTTTPAPTPTPTPTPTPRPTPAGAWDDTSNSHQFTTLASHVEHVASAGGKVASTIAPKGADEVQIAYSVADQAYLITLPGIGQGKLVGRELQNSAGKKLAFVDFEPKSSGYTYANLAYWVSGDGTNDLKIGAFVFGTPTASGDVPVSGRATYLGTIAAETDDAFVRTSEGFVTPVYITGTVTMNFDFAAGNLSGQIAPELDCWNCLYGTPLAASKFTQTVFSTGSTSFSGKFDTALPGANWFNGIFAGPNAAEAMAKFQAPYIDPLTSQKHEMSGVWVAKKGP
jgi:hypothetical protein